MRWHNGTPLIVGVLGATVMTAGCVGLLEPRRELVKSSTVGESPLAQTTSLFYPLEVGNHWDYQNDFSFVIVPTGENPGTPSVIHSTLDIDLTGTEERFGRDYVVQRESDGVSEWSFLYRQDKSGLYNADPEPATASHVSRGPDVEVFLARSLGDASESVRNAYRAAWTRVMAKHAAVRQLALRGGALGATTVGVLASGPLPGEIAILRYPLASSKTWQVREDPRFVDTVEGAEGLDLPAGTFNGWRIRIDSELFGPNDRIHVWYGRDGLLQLVVHAEGAVVDENGNTIGTILSDQTQRLSGLSLVRNAGS